MAGALAGGAVTAGVGFGVWRAGAADEFGQHLGGVSLQRPGDAGMLALDSLRGRPLVVNFWATWCVPCVEEMPLLDRFHAEQRAKGWQVLAIAIDNAQAVGAFVKQHALALPVALGGYGGVELTRRLGNTAGGLPYSVLFDSHGRVRERKTGALTAADLERWKAIEV
nr:TlpA disulfide reductase family protein [Schlegelella koreensis]